MAPNDVAVPGDYMVAIMAGEGILDEVKPGELANIGNVEAQWMDVPFDSGRKHSIPYQWGSTSFSVNRDVYSGDINTTSILFDPPAELSGKINVLDSQGEVMLMATLHLGIPQCTNDRVVLLEGAPNRANALKFMDFLLEPENIAAVTNYARYAAGVKGVTDLLDSDLTSAPESVPPADAPSGTFIAVCDQKTQEVYDAIWTRLKK